MSLRLVEKIVTANEYLNENANFEPFSISNAEDGAVPNQKQTNKFKNEFPNNIGFGETE